ncbi:MAG: YccF domain-containing protein [Actinobacteria bacterium]|nr:YccF domain-containing protein [Actinomycetota bacterium]
MRILLNLIWLIVAGVELAIGYAVAALLAVVFVVTIPLAVPALRLAGYALWPFGRVVVEDPGAGAGSFLMNVVWFLVAGWWLFLGHLLVGLLLCLTIIGIPFGIAVFKMGRLAVAPYGKDVVDAGAAASRTVVQAGPTHAR